MDEATKTRVFRGQHFVNKYLGGRVLDIGCGPDLVVPTAQPFDLEHGDANCICDYLPPGSFDCVHSSHCLEHMRSAPAALAQWWALVKPGGYLIVTVPHEDLYEQGVWPPMFNLDHKSTFRLDKVNSWSPVSHDMRKLFEDLPGAEVLEAAVQDAGYNHRWKGKGIHPLGVFADKFFAKRKGLCRRLGLKCSPALDEFDKKVAAYLGKPFDQTLGNALAQIQVVARKRSALSSPGVALPSPPDRMACATKQVEKLPVHHRIDRG